jgi:hypothetical protein
LASGKPAGLQTQGYMTTGKGAFVGFVVFSVRESGGEKQANVYCEVLFSINLTCFFAINFVGLLGVSAMTSPFHSISSSPLKSFSN